MKHQSNVGLTRMSLLNILRVQLLDHEMRKLFDYVELPQCSSERLSQSVIPPAVLVPKGVPLVSSLTLDIVQLSDFYKINRIM